MKDGNTFEVADVVSFDIVNPLVKALLESKAKTITLVINSPGGEVTSGLYLLNTMALKQARGTKFRCVTTSLAASMAFQIFAACDVRYALPNTFLLYHPVRISLGGDMFSPAVTLTPRLARELAYDLERIERILVRDLRRWMPVSNKTFFRNYHAETLLLAREVNVDSPNWLTIVDDIKGLKSIQLGVSNHAEGRFIYICDKCTNLDQARQ
tara:strand:+ start:487 stop:1119 length:633 start_codon:yes stop_codon:yes gene_type:complete